MIVKVGGITALLLFVILFIKFLAQLPASQLDGGAKGQQFVQILIVSVIILVIAVPEGLPLAVTLALAYATIRMLEDHNLVRVLKACETMGNATTVCSDKTGTLTQNKMTVVEGTLGVSHGFGGAREIAREMGGTAPENESFAETTNGGHVGSASVQRFFSELSPEVKTLLRQSIAVNSTAFEGTDASGAKEFIGSKTETALLEFSQTNLGMDDLSTERHNVSVVELFPFSSERKCMGVVVKIQVEGDTRYRLFVKGASEILLSHCKRVVNIGSDVVNVGPLFEADREALKSTIDKYAAQSLRTIGLLSRDFFQWPPADTPTGAKRRAQTEFEVIFQDMTWIGVVGIRDPLRQGVVKAVQDCQNAGVFVRMVTGDSVITARAIASECGIFTAGGIVVEGPRFRTLSPAQMVQIIPRLQVLARSSPEDKRNLVRRLKELGEIVAVTGDGTNDGPALRTADVGFSMGISGTEVAKEASSIVLMDDNFASIVKAIMWGRCVNDAVKKFLQVESHTTYPDSSFS
jgi:Ca2+-transporting ATPase